MTASSCYALIAISAVVRLPCVLGQASAPFNCTPYGARIDAVANAASSLGYNGDFGAALAAEFGAVNGLSHNGSHLLVADETNSAARLIGPNGIVITLAGAPVAPASFRPQVVQLLADSEHPLWAALVAEGSFSRVRAIAHNRSFLPIAGNGSSGYAGDGGPSVQAQLAALRGLLFVANRSIVYIADEHRIRAVALDAQGVPTVITTVLGSAMPVSTCVTASNASTAGANYVAGLVYDPPRDRVIFADAGARCIRALTPAGGVLRIAGFGFSLAEGVLPSAVLMASPFAFALALDRGTGDGDILFYSDLQRFVVRAFRLSPASGAAAGVYTTAGRDSINSPAYAVNNGFPALSAILPAPRGIAFNPQNGTLLIADSSLFQIRAVSCATAPQPTSTANPTPTSTVTPSATYTHVPIASDAVLCPPGRGLLAVAGPNDIGVKSSGSSATLASTVGPVLASAVRFSAVASLLWVEQLQTLFIADDGALPGELPPMTWSDSQATAPIRSL